MAEDFKVKDFSDDKSEKQPKKTVKPTGEKEQVKAPAPKAAAPKSAAKPASSLIEVKAVYRDTAHPGTAQMIFANRWTPVDGTNQWVKNMLAAGKFVQK